MAGDRQALCSDGEEEGVAILCWNVYRHGQGKKYTSTSNGPERAGLTYLNPVHQVIPAFPLCKPFAFPQSILESACPFPHQKNSRV